MPTRVSAATNGSSPVCSAGPSEHESEVDEEAIDTATCPELTKPVREHGSDLSRLGFAHHPHAADDFIVDREGHRLTVPACGPRPRGPLHDDNRATVGLGAQCERGNDETESKSSRANVHVHWVLRLAARRRQFKLFLRRLCVAQLAQVGSLASDGEHSDRGGSKPGTNLPARTLGRPCAVRLVRETPLEQICVARLLCIEFVLSMHATAAVIRSILLEQRHLGAGVLRLTRRLPPRA
eukprot:scaffold98880_cov33-Tisochrysis_lutea.AAC.1